MHVVFEELPTLVVLTRPAPEIFALTALFATLQYTSADHPHNDAEHEPTDCEHGVVDGNLLSATVTATAVSENDDDSKDEGYAGNSEDDYLRPDGCAFSPGRKVVAGRDGLGCVEDGENSGEHGEHDEGT